MLRLVLILVAATCSLSGGLAAQTSNPAPKDPLEIGPSEPGAPTVPRSAYKHPEMTLEEQEAASRNSGASQEVNKYLNRDENWPDAPPSSSR